MRPGHDIQRLLNRCDGRATAGQIPDAIAWSDLVFLAVPANVAVDVVRKAGPFDRRILIDCTNPVGWHDGPVVEPPPEGSVAQAIAAVTDATVVKAFNHFGAEVLANPRIGGAPAEAFIASDDKEAIRSVGSIARRAGFTPRSVGPLRNASLLEHLAVLWIHLASQEGLGRRFAFRIDVAGGP